MAIIADTHKVINLLRQRGFTQQQAEGIVQVFGEIDTSFIATKSDVAEIKGMMKVLISLTVGVVLLELGQFFV